MRNNSLETAQTVSKSRTYIAVCNRSKFDGYYCKKFTLPEKEENTTEHAAWYFLNELDFTACLEMILTIEDYSDLRTAI